MDDLLSPGSKIPLTSDQLPWITSVLEVGTLVSTLPAGKLVNYVGRKPVILATAPLFIVSWLVIIYFPSPLVLGAMRVLQGFALGFTYTATPVYLGEIASKSTRGAITSIFFNSWWLGYIVEFAVGPYLSFYNFTYFTLALNIPFLLLFVWQPESPYYFMMTGREDKARETLHFFRDTSPQQIEEELLEIKQSVVESSLQATRMRDMLDSYEDRRALALLLILSAVRIMSGTGWIFIYATQLFQQTPNLPISADSVTLTLGLVIFAAGCVGTCIADSLGRRPLLLFSCAGSLICQCCTGIYYFLLLNTSIKVSKFSWIPAALILVYSAFCCAGFYPVCSAYTSELFTAHTRGFASSFAGIVVTVSTFVALLTYQPISYHFGLYTNFFINSLYIFVGLIIFYFWAPETKDKSFDQIRRDLRHKRA